MKPAPLLLLLSFAAPLSAAERFPLKQLEQLTLASNPGILASRQDDVAANARVSSASALPNPELEYLEGTARARQPGAAQGTLRSYGLSLPLDMPWRRAPRIAGAKAGLAATQASTRAYQADVLAELRLRFYDVLRREAELRNAREDLAITEGIQSRIRARVNTGETGRIELIKSDAETLIAQLGAQASELRVTQARTALAQITGLSLPAGFQLEGTLASIPDLPTLDVLHNELQTGNPDLQRVRAEIDQAREQVALERALRLPSLGLKAAVDIEPDQRLSRVGLTVTVPIFDWRKGPIAEAEAGFRRSQHQLQNQDFTLTQKLDIAWQQHEIASRQVTALETGILRQTEAALNGAQTAYRNGERSFLDVLDAQRVHRAARNELISARFELASAWVAIERLRAAPGEER